jgi:hypothetical protein
LKPLQHLSSHHPIGAHSTEAKTECDGRLVEGKRDFLRTFDAGGFDGWLWYRAIPGRSGRGGFGEVEGQQVGDLCIDRALRRLGDIR